MSGCGKALALAILFVCELLGMSLWFSASAVLPSLKAQYPMSGMQAAALASGVALGFVAGTLLSAVLGLADRIEPRKLFATSAVVGALATGVSVWVDPTSILFILLRIIVGASLAGVYPPAIKMMAGWAAGDLGLLVGVLVAASTLGGSSAFLLAAFGALDWRSVQLGAAAMALLGALLIQAFQPGPAHRQATVFRARYVLDAWRNKSLRFANFGYYGHMWELYALWTWIAAFAEASFRFSAATADAIYWAKLAAFATIGCGAIGSLAGGVLADRFGRTSLTIGAMLLSGSCALLAGVLFGGPVWLIMAFCAVWGIAAVADSAQFSASVVELSDPERVGTMVTVQTCVGFLLTMVSIHLVPPIDAAIGWRWTFVFLAAGPFLGAVAMYTLRRLPEANRLAGGRR